CYLQATEDTRTISVTIEKQQVSVLAERLSSLLEEIASRFDAEVPEEAPDELVDNEPLSVPVEEEFRVGTMGLGWDAESQAVVVELLAVTEGEVDETVVLDDTEEGPDAVRVFLSPPAARAFASRADRVVGAGRKPCPLCGEPLDPAGHICPRQNGYRRDSELTDES
ncbi:putative repeat protein (TIGR03847 family), partial [Prauserella sediminis]